MGLKNNFMKQTLIVTVGLPRSGKTTWAKEQAKKGIPVISLDDVRLTTHGKRFLKEAEPLVWKKAKQMIDALFMSGSDTVILDECNVTAYERAYWASPSWKVKYKYFKTTKEECIQRAERLEDPEIIIVIKEKARLADYG